MLKYNQLLNRSKDEPENCGFSGSSLDILKDRYLQNGETVKTSFERIASYVSANEADHDLMFKMLVDKHIMFSSTFASDRNDDISRVACKLIAPALTNDYETQRLMIEGYTINSKGTGIGVDVSMIPATPVMDDSNSIKASIPEIMKYYDNASLLTIMVRKPKTALYTHVHCDNIEPLINTRLSKNDNCPINVFVGVMINEYFLQMVIDNNMWNLFPGHLVPKLHVASQEDYMKIYNEYSRDPNIPRKTILASTLYHKIVNAITVAGIPYIINIDIANKYNNQYKLGPVRTFNLCAEITGVATPESSSDCILASISVARANQETINILKSRFSSDLGLNISFEDFRFKELAEFSYYLARCVCFGLNVAIKDKPRREIGISPMGFSDYVLTHDDLYDSFDDVKLMCAEMSEAIYLGAIVESLLFSETYHIVDINYFKTRFCEGKTQFDLRGISPIYSRWESIRNLMKTKTMANSMLTCQAPTVTTSSILEVNESIQLPRSIAITKMDVKSRQMYLYTGFKQWCNRNNYTLDNDESLEDLFKSHKLIKLINDKSWKPQFELYVASAPFIDHSQSVVYNIPMDHDTIHKIILKSRKGQLKTGLYYAQMTDVQKVILSNGSRKRNLDSISNSKRKRTSPNECVSCSM